MNTRNDLSRIRAIKDKVKQMEAESLERKAMSDDFSLDRFEAHIELGPILVEMLNQVLSMGETALLANPGKITELENILNTEK